MVYQTKWREAHWADERVYMNGPMVREKRCRWRSKWEAGLNRDSIPVAGAGHRSLGSIKRSGRSVEMDGVGELEEASGE